MARTDALFAITLNGGNYSLNIENDEGKTTEFELSFDQLDLLSEAIDEHLNADEEEMPAAEKPEE